MAKLFNKDRKKLLDQNKTIQYLKYAIGEILLVVIGILIALYISNWSESRKEREAEKYILGEVLSNLKEDAVLINQIIGQRLRSKKSVENMLTYLPTHTVNGDSLSSDLIRFITFERYFPINNAFEMLKSKGLKLSNNKLTSRISRYYDYDQHRTQRSVEDIEEAIMPILLNSKGIKRFITTLKLNEYITLTNPNDLQFQNELYHELNGFKDNNSGTLIWLTGFREANKLLVQDLEAELRRLND
jgi:Family of unknown function (DUF6090)